MLVPGQADVAQKMVESPIWQHEPEIRGHCSLLTRIPTIDEVLNDQATALRDDLLGYRHHVYRILNLCVAIVGRSEFEKIAVAAVFHDLAIWTKGTFDYIAPSIALAHEYLVARGRDDWTADIEGMIANHHKITRSTADPGSLIEAFRRADWVDVTLGVRRFGIPRPFVARLFATWPSAGFHRRLAILTLDRFRSHPLTPLPTSNCKATRSAARRRHVVTSGPAARS